MFSMPALALGNNWNYFRRILRSLSLIKKIEYTAKIAPAQLGKAKVKGYNRPAATG